MTPAEVPDLREFVRKQRRLDAGFFEQRLWSLAEKAPLGSSLIGSVDDPYLLRVYVSPRSPQFQWLWAKLRWYSSDIGDFDPSLVQDLPHLYLHYFFRGDSDREVHNHPWGFSMSLILTGGYIEERWDPEVKKIRSRPCYAGDLNVIRANDFHRVTLIDPAKGCWTLFLSHHRVQEKDGHDWGFLDTATGKYTPWGPFTEQRKQASPKSE